MIFSGEEKELEKEGKAGAGDLDRETNEENPSCL